VVGRTVCQRHHELKSHEELLPSDVGQR
jgi:hypothetical protein